jgi:hypothetical protein
MEHDEGRVRFLDGMRVTIEHMEHLQSLWLSAALQLRQTVGAGKVCYGLKVESVAADKVKVGAGLAFDRNAHPISLDAEREVAVNFGSSSTLHLVVVYTQRSEGLVNGVPTLISDDLKIETRAGAPPYADGAVLFAELQKGDGAISVVQKGEWYLPPLDHGHSGEFKLDEGLRWRYDGHQVGLQMPRFDSGFLPVEPGSPVQLVHGLKTANLLVQLQARRDDGIITTDGFGQEFWYELIGDQEVRVVRRGGVEAAVENLELRVMLWPASGQSGAAPVLPVADAGDNVVIDQGESFGLDASRSRAFGGRQLIKYIWQQFS